MKRVLKYSASSYGNLQHSNALHKRAASHALQIYGPNAIYSFIPKNACSTLRLSLAIENGCIENESDYNWVHQNNDTFVATLRDLICADYTFVILRCPFSRLASTYLDKIVMRTPVMWGLRTALNHSFEPSDLTFRRFVNLLQNPHVRQMDIHWRDQTSFLVYKDYDDYFQLERFADASLVLHEKIDLTVVDGRSLFRHGTDIHQPLDQGCFADTAPGELLALRLEGKSPSPRALYSDDIVAQVRTAFKSDLDLYVEKFGPGDLLFPQ